MNKVKSFGEILRECNPYYMRSFGEILREAIHLQESEVSIDKAVSILNSMSSTTDGLIMTEFWSTVRRIADPTFHHGEPIENVEPIIPTDVNNNQIDFGIWLAGILVNAHIELGKNINVLLKLKEHFLNVFDDLLNPQEINRIQNGINEGYLQTQINRRLGAIQGGQGQQ